MTTTNPYDPPGLIQDRKRFTIPDWLLKLLLYCVAFTVFWDLTSVDPSSLLSWFRMSQIDLTFRAFVCLVFAVPIFLVGHLVVSSNSNAGTLCRALIAGIAMGIYPSQLFHLERLIDWLSLRGIGIARLLYRQPNQWAFDVLVVILVEVLIVIGWRILMNAKKHKT